MSGDYISTVVSMNMATMKATVVVIQIYLSFQRLMLVIAPLLVAGITTAAIISVATRDGMSVKYE